MNTITQPNPKGFKVPTLSTLSESQADVIRNLPKHEDYVAPVVTSRQPASVYKDDARYQLEQEKIFRKFPVPVCPSVMVKEPGTVFAHDGYGLPLLITRDKEGQVHAFLNACMHKGSKLIESCSPEKASRITCPYHAWTFALDGRLVGVPREETFGGLNKADRPLAKLPCKEAGGLIWAILDKNAEPDFSSLDAQIIEDFDHLGLGDAYLYGHKTFDLKANWKLVLEPFQEAYHVRRLHAATVGPLFADGCAKIDYFGPHTRQVSGKVHFKPELLEDPGLNIHSAVTHAYQIFPCTVIITSPYYLSILIIMPQGPRNSKVDYYNLNFNPADNPKAQELFEKSWQMVLGVFGGEDFRAAELSQVGLDSGALEDVVYCGLEETIPVYYKHLNTLLGISTEGL